MEQPKPRHRVAALALITTGGIWIILTDWPTLYYSDWYAPWSGLPLLAALPGPMLLALGILLLSGITAPTTLPWPPSIIEIIGTILFIAGFILEDNLEKWEHAVSRRMQFVILAPLLVGGLIPFIRFARRLRSLKRLNKNTRDPDK